MHSLKTALGHEFGPNGEVLGFSLIAFSQRGANTIPHAFHIRDDQSPDRGVRGGLTFRSEARQESVCFKKSDVFIRILLSAFFATLP